MESLTQPQFIAFLLTVGVPLIALVWNQIQTNKKLTEMVKAQERRQQFFQATLDKIEQHIERSSREHAVLMDRTSTKDQ